MDKTPNENRPRRLLIRMTVPLGLRGPTFCQLHVQASDGKTEVYEQTDAVTPPHRSSPNTALDDIPPHGMVLSQFIFDVPTDVEPELLAVTEEPTLYSSQDVGVVDLRDDNPQGPRPQEILALQYEYYNMGEYERDYELYTQESKDRVSEQLYVSSIRQQDQKDGGFTLPKYSFPSVEIEGDHATMQVVRSYSSQEESEGQDRVSHDAVLEGEGWRILMHDGQYEFFLGE